jgi:aspartate dehydrogenase
MSVGALLQDGSWRALAERGRATVHVPSGALAGLDGIRAMASGRLTHASLTTRKPPRALADAPYVRSRGIRLRGLRRPKTVVQGSPAGAVKAFPQNINVAAALALAASSGGGRPTIRVRVVADPSIRRNTHELDVRGDSGRIRCRIESVPSANPKTSELAVRSAVATLGRLFGRVQLGT